MKDIPVHDPDSGDYIGDLRVCVFCGMAACLTWEPCARRQAPQAVWPPVVETR